MSEEGRNHEVLPYVSTWTHEMVGDVVLLADGSYGVAWELTPFDLLTFDDDNTLTLENHIYSLLAALPYGSYRLNADEDHKQAGAYYQLISFRSDDFSREFERMDSVTIGRNDLPAKAVHEHNEYIKYLARNGVFVKRRPILFLRYYPEQKNAKQASNYLSFLSYSVKPSAIAELVTGQRIRQLANELLNIEGVMRQGSLSPARLNATALRRVLYDFLNPASQTAGVPLDLNYTLRSQVFPDFTPGHYMFELDGVWHAVLSLRTLPSTITSCSGNFFKMADGDVIMNFTIFPTSLTERIIKIKRRSMKVSFAEPNIREGKRDIEEADNMLKQGTTFGVASLHVLLRDADPDKLQLKVRNTMALFSRIDGIECRPERRSAPAIFFSACVPFACGPAFEKLSYRAKLNALPWIANLLPIFGGFSGTATRPVLSAPTMDNPQSIYTYDPFDESQVNWNTMLIGKSGSGKSTFVIRMMLSFLLYNPLLFFIEKGTQGCSSYRRFSLINGGKHFEISRTNPHCINVFDATHIDTTDETALSGVVSFATSFCEILAGDLESGEFSALSIAIRNLFADHDKYYMTDLCEHLSRGDEDSVKVAKKLALFTKKGALGEFVDGDTSIVLDVDIASFDLDGIYDEPRLLPAYFMAIDHLIRRRIKECPTQKHITLYDEVWKPLEFPSVRKMLLGKNRTVRKEYGGGAVFYVDQLVSTFDDYPETRKILQQTTNWFLLEMERPDIPLLEKAGFTKREQEVVSKLKTEPGKSSTAYARYVDSGMPRGAVIINDVTPLNYAIMTNDGDDLRVFSELENELKRKGMPHEIQDVIKAFAELLPKGVRPLLASVREIMEQNKDLNMLDAVREAQRRIY